MREKVLLETMRNRRTRLEREKAMAAARCPKDSKFGECLLNIKTKDDPVLSKSLGRINSEIRRMEFQMKQLRQTFVRQSKFLNHEPLILIERPASPEIHHRKVVMDTGADDPGREKLPGYMRPLRSQIRTPSVITTIDAFLLNTRKKRNVWEEAMDERDTPRFKSTVRPCAKLTQREIKEIRHGWSSHKPRFDGDRRSPSPARTSPRSLPNDTTVFITQLPRSAAPKSADGRLGRTVRFKETETELPQNRNKPRRPKSTIHLSQRLHLLGDVSA